MLRDVIQEALRKRERERMAACLFVVAVGEQSFTYAMTKEDAEEWLRQATGMYSEQNQMYIRRATVEDLAG